MVLAEIVPASSHVGGMDRRVGHVKRLTRFLCASGAIAVLIALVAACQTFDGIGRSPADRTAPEPVRQLEASPTGMATVRIPSSRSALTNLGVSTTTRGEASVPAPTSTDAQQELRIEDLVQLARPSIVHLATESVARDNSGRTVPAGGVGTGFVIDAEGLIVTNNHVVAGAEQIVVTTYAGDLYDATVVGRDPQTDLAVLRIDASGLQPIALGTSADLRIGESVVAIGHALDLPGGPTVTVGVVSALDRTITNVGPQRLTLSDLIQTDASINPGNSGGPLLDLHGEVVGVNSAGAGSFAGIGFAIAIDGARPVIAELIQSGQVERGFLGIGPATVTRSVARQFNLPVSAGILVVQITNGSPAAGAGLRPGDILVDIDGTAVPDAGALSRVLAQYSLGSEVTVRYIRPGGDDQPQETRVRLGRVPINR